MPPSRDVPDRHADQPLGVPVSFTAASPPDRTPMVGTHVTLRPVDPRADAAPLYRISHLPDGDPRIWTYLFDGPYPDLASFASELEVESRSDDPLFLTVVRDRQPQGQVAFLAIVPDHGTIELGYIWFGPGLARTAAGTEAIFLMLTRAFDQLGFRRVEWKCHALNAPSRRAAERLGFLYEGTFAQHRVVKGHNRDTAWFAITDARWPRVRQALQAWLDPANFDAAGEQRHTLETLRGAER
ncbi:MAG TPA: GNAT family protein [Solirubrobacteraceae bacterium]|nr:GNAT family protein [Solirubrobacteraceae bacterium]